MSGLFFDLDRPGPKFRLSGASPRKLTRDDIERMIRAARQEPPRHPIAWVHPAELERLEKLEKEIFK